MDFIEALKEAKDFVIPIAGAVAGFIATSYAVRTRVKNLEKNLATTKKGWRLELETLKGDLDKDLEEYKKKLRELEEKLHNVQRESSSFASDEELSRFIEDQQRQWQAIQRTLGQIEGMLRKLP